jgi:transcriptional regulator with XRE-family HTH domain
MTERQRGNDIGEITLRVARNVGLLRQHRAMSLEALAIALEAEGRALNPSSLSKLERGLRRIDLDDLSALASALGVSDQQLMTTDVNWLLGRGFTADVSPDETQALQRLDEFNRLRAFEERILAAVEDLAREADHNGER